jgi:choline kinase
MNLILAAGQQNRWEHEKFPIKQLIEIDGKTLIERIQWQFGGAVVTHTPEILAKSQYVYRPEKFRWTVETLLSTAEFWRNQQIITLGDVYYTKEAVEAIKDFKGDMQFFGTIHEIFAISFTDFEGVKKHLKEAVKRLEQIIADIIAGLPK